MFYKIKKWIGRKILNYIERKATDSDIPIEDISISDARVRVDRDLTVHISINASGTISLPELIKYLEDKEL